MLVELRGFERLSLPAFMPHMQGISDHRVILDGSVDLRKHPGVFRRGTSPSLSYSDFDTPEDTPATLGMTRTSTKQTRGH